MKTRHIWFGPLGRKVLDTFGSQSQIMFLIIFTMRLNSSPSMQTDAEFGVGYRFLSSALVNFVSQICSDCFESKKKAWGQRRGTFTINVHPLFLNVHFTNYRKTQESHQVLTHHKKMISRSHYFLWHILYFFLLVITFILQKTKVSLCNSRQVE